MSAVSAAAAAAPYPFVHLLLYGYDLTQRAREGRCSPVIGRDAELRRVIEVLSRKTKSNPLLISDPGVGKTSIVEGLAQRMVRGDVPKSLPKYLFALDLAALIAGTKYQGEFEQRLNALLKEIQDASEARCPVILFIDELHSLIGAGRSGGGALDASNILKPALARDLACIGATTHAEYERYVAKDAAFQRRFQAVVVEEPSTADAVSMLRGLRVGLENHHGVSITDAAIVQAVKLSQRYLPARRLPDKAIDLVDEAAASIRVQLDSQPLVIEVLVRRKLPLEIEYEALRSDKTDAAAAAGRARARAIEEELAAIDVELGPLQARYDAERRLLEQMRVLKRRKESIEAGILVAEREKNVARAAQLRWTHLPEVEAQLASRTRRHEQVGCIVSEVVTAEHISQLVSRSTGIPAARMSLSERQKLLSLDRELAKRVVGQTRAIRAVSDALLRSRVGLGAARRPIGSFLFTSGSGVGKTALAKALQAQMFDDEDGMIRFDMSEYSEPHSISRLIGAPPGYVGSDQGGLLTDAVRRRAYSVVCFDEFEKASPKVFDLLLQILDEGRLTDSRGTTVDFSNTLIILTANVGAHHVYDSMGVGGGGGGGGCLSEATLAKVMDEVKRAFRPEFLNRLDEVVCFEPLRRPQMEQIAHMRLRQINESLAEHGVQVTCSDGAFDHIIRRATANPADGARPLGRYLERAVVTEVSRFLAERDERTRGRGGGFQIMFDVFQDKLVYTHVSL